MIMTQKESVVLLVFYHVDPRDVGKQGGSFKDEFLDHTKDADQEEEIIKMWKIALKKAAKLADTMWMTINNTSFPLYSRNFILHYLHFFPL